MSLIINTEGACLMPTVVKPDETNHNNNNDDPPTSSAFHPVNASTAGPLVKPLRSPSSPQDGGTEGRSSTTSLESPSPPSTRRGSNHHRIPPGPVTFDWPANSQDDERRELLGTEEESSEMPSSDEDNNNNDEDDNRKNIWTITKEQLNYYTAQFLTMQPDLKGVVPGALAKEFFEQSRLPIAELRKIWQLSDVSKDGCLCLEEFLTAMHLVVLRRNDVALPDELPSCLRPEEDIQGSPKPVNFDGRRDLKRDPNILAPVAVRLSPDSPCVQTSDEEDDKPAVKTKHGVREVVYEQLWNQDDAASNPDESTKDNGVHNDTDRVDNPGPVSLPSVNPLGLTKKVSPPPPPPRLSQERTHARSSSLDLSRFNGRYPRSNNPPPPPPPPPRYPRGASTDFTGIGLGVGIDDSPNYRPTTTTSTTTTSAASMALRRSGQDLLLHTASSNFRSFHQNIHNLKEANSVVARTINELHQEVSDAMEERIALEYQLEQLKSFGE